MTAPILYSFRRCPYAMRARMAIVLGRREVELREVKLRAKPAAMIEASPKATVPVLVLPDGEVIEESLAVMEWALRDHQEGPEWPTTDDADGALALIAQNDGPFKHHLDRYKYSTRYEGVEAETHRAEGSAFLAVLDQKLSAQHQLFGVAATLADIAIFPFVRQFRIADPDWFDAQDWPHLHRWLQDHMASDLFVSVMEKYEPWQDGPGIAFPGTALAA